MLEENNKVELNDEELNRVTGGGDVFDCDWNGIVKYQIELGKAYVRNNVSFCVYVPIAHVASPGKAKEGLSGGQSFHVFSCKYYEYGKYQNIHDVSFGENDVITEAIGVFN